MRKFLLFIAALCCAAMVNAKIYEGKIGDNLTYSFDTKVGELIIDGTGPMYDYSSTLKTPFISQTYNGYNLGDLIKTIRIWSGATTLGAYALGEIEATSISIPSTVTEFKKGALYKCINLQSVSLPMGLEKIGDNAFSGCSSLTEIYIWGSVTEIGNSVFEKCTALENIEVSENNEHFISYDGVLYTRDNALKRVPIGKQLTSYTVVAGTEIIYGYAFDGCASLQSIILPASVDTLNYNVFMGCTSLTSITCYATTPPQVYKGTFSGIDSSITIYVPKGAKAAYEAADYWNAFPIVELDDQEGITSPSLQGRSGEASKSIKDGQLLIERNGKTYNAQGAEIK